MHTPQADTPEWDRQDEKHQNCFRTKSVFNKKGVNTSSIPCVKYRLESQICSDVNWKEWNTYAYNEIIQSRETLSKHCPQTKLLQRNTVESRVTTPVLCRERELCELGVFVGVSPWGVLAAPHTQRPESTSLSAEAFKLIMEIISMCFCL